MNQHPVAGYLAGRLDTAFQAHRTPCKRSQTKTVKRRKQESIRSAYKIITPVTVYIPSKVPEGMGRASRSAGGQFASDHAQPQIRSSKTGWPADLNEAEASSQ